MNRYVQLKRLKDEVRRLFNGGFCEKTVFNLLRDDKSQFANVTQEEVESLYRQIQEETNTKKEHERKVEEYRRKIFELEQMQKCRQKASNHLIYEESSTNPIQFENIWQGRYVVAADDRRNNDKVHTFKIKDLFQNAKKSFTVQKKRALCNFYMLSFPFVLFHEHKEYTKIHYLRLAKFNLESKSIEGIHWCKFSNFRTVLVDQFNPSKFMLQIQPFAIHECRLINGLIRIGEGFNVDWNSNSHCVSYYDGQLYDLEFGWDELNEMEMLIYNLKQKKSEKLKLNPLPKNLIFSNQLEKPAFRFKWLRDHVFTSVQFRATFEYGIVFTEPQTCSWTIVEFMTSFSIKRIQFVDGLDLMICAEKSEGHNKPCKRNIYKVPMRKPDFLRNMAWNVTVNLFKQAKVKDPYEQARQYLPFNSDIQALVFIED